MTTEPKRKRKTKVDASAEQWKREQDEIDRLLATDWRARAEELEAALGFVRRYSINTLGALLQGIHDTGEVEGQRLDRELRWLAGMHIWISELTGEEWDDAVTRRMLAEVPPSVMDQIRTTMRGAFSDFRAKRKGG
jgi:hypothetical protein